MLAMNLAFLPQSDYKTKGNLYARIARYAAEKNHGRFSLQLVQCRLLIGLYYSAQGDSAIVWDFGGSAFRAASDLWVNLERGIIGLDNKQPLDYGLNKHGLAECHRRTYWSTFIVDVSLF